MAREVTIGAHTVRVVYAHESHGGVFSPALWVYLKGPNGSPAGIGPKGWPRILRPLFPSYNGRRDRWSSSLEIGLPCLTWARAYRLRRVGGYQLYSLSQWFYRRVRARAAR
jgi:hypothetical protein